MGADATKGAFTLLLLAVGLLAAAAEAPTALKKIDRGPRRHARETLSRALMVVNNKLDKVLQPLKLEKEGYIPAKYKKFYSNEEVNRAALLRRESRARLRDDITKGLEAAQQKLQDFANTWISRPKAPGSSFTDRFVQPLWNELKRIRINFISLGRPERTAELVQSMK